MPAPVGPTTACGRRRRHGWTSRNGVEPSVLPCSSGGRTEMLVPFRPRPHRRKRDHVGEIQSADGRLADIRVGMSGQAAEPGVNRVDRLDHGGEVAALNDLLDQAQLLVGKARVGIPDGDGRRDIGHARHVGAEFLQGHVGVGGLVGGVRIDERGCLVGHHLLEDRGDALALGEPLPPDLGQQPGRVGLVEQDRAGGPSVGKGQPVHLVEQAGRRRGREAGDGQDAQMLRRQGAAPARRSAADRRAARRDTSAFPARGRDAGWSRWWNGGRSAFRRHRASGIPA